MHDLETGRVRSLRADTVRLLADALRLAGPQRESWFAAAPGVNRPRGPVWARPAPVPGGAPPRPLTAFGFDMGNKSRCRRRFTRELGAETSELCRRGDGSVGQAANDVGRMKRQCGRGPARPGRTPRPAMTAG